MSENYKKNEKEIANDKANRIMNIVARKCAYFRANPQRFCSEYLGLKLKLFQKILIYAMMHNNYFMYIAARGQGKSYLTALFLIVRALLFPKSKLIVSAPTRSQANEVLLKIIDDFMVESDILATEVLKYNVGQNSGAIYFKNGSWIRSCTSSDTSRSLRANILLVDEFVKVDPVIINTVLRKFLTSPRQPGYLKKEKYKHLQERNKELYLSSAWYKSHWSFLKLKSYFVNFLSEKKKYFLCALPYQVSIAEGLLSIEQVEDEMSEKDFDAITFEMEMEAMFFSDTDGTFFTYSDISKRMKLKDPFYSFESGVKQVIPDLIPGERRFLSADIALMASKKHNNDASSIMVNRAIPNQSGTSFISNFVYMNSYEGMTTDDLALIIRRAFYYFKCTDLVIDAQGVGTGVYDLLIKDMYDPETGENYDALTCCNNKDMADRCKVLTARPVIWSIKAGASFNNEMCTLLRMGFQNGKINLLMDKDVIEDHLRSKIKGYQKMQPSEQLKYKVPYIQTSLAINELINLESDTSGVNIKIKEKSGARKDRYSSMGYNFWATTQCERELVKSTEDKFDTTKFCVSSIKFDL